MMYDHCASTVRASVMHITLTERLKQTQTADDDPALEFCQNSGIL